MGKLLKKIALLTIISILTIANSAIIKASNNSFFVSITIEAYERHSYNKEERNHRGHRLPGKYIWEGTLDKMGYTNIPDDILQYEIWNEKDDVCLAIFSDEREFVECLLNLQGEYYIHLITPDILYIGTITIEY